MTKTARLAAIFGLTLALGGCTVHQTVPPGVTGPSEDSTTFAILAGDLLVNVPITFDGSASKPGSGANQIVGFKWDFGDGTIDTTSGSKAKHIFTVAGSFTVVLTTTDDRGGVSSSGRLVQIRIGAAPTGDFTISPTQPLVGDTVSFNGLGVKPAPGRSIVGYAWDFGDASKLDVDSGPFPTHVYKAPGTYVVVLTVVDDSGQIGVFQKNITVASGNPTALFTFSPATPTATDNVTFDASASTALGSATIVSYTWSIGGAPASGPVVSHVFGSAGTFPVTLIVMDDQGRKGVASQNVVVK